MGLRITRKDGTYFDVSGNTWTRLRMTRKDGTYFDATRSSGLRMTRKDGTFFDIGTPGSCANVNCGSNAFCSGGRCYCTNIGAWPECEDPCDMLDCGPRGYCENDGAYIRCRCLVTNHGYEPEWPACEYDPCESMICGPKAHCSNAECFCSGYGVWPECH